MQSNSNVDTLSKFPPLPVSLTETNEGLQITFVRWEQLRAKMGGFTGKEGGERKGKKDRGGSTPKENIKREVKVSQFVKWLK